jgi:hypothetical protein
MELLDIFLRKMDGPYFFDLGEGSARITEDALASVPASLALLLRRGGGG